MVLVMRLIYGTARWRFFTDFIGRLEPLDMWGLKRARRLARPAGCPAVNTLLLVLEVGGETELAADSVFWTTVASCVTIPAWLVVIRLSTG